MKKFLKFIATVIVLCAVVFFLREFFPMEDPEAPSATLDGIPTFSGDPYVNIDEGQPGFTVDEITTTSYEHYSELDRLGRCGVVTACCGRDLMPTTDRGSISSVYPSGWEQAKYDFVDGSYLYNRCHLIGWQLTGEDANERNLITGTRYINIEGMLPFENMVADYIKETGNHVMYRVTPIYEGNNLVASGVQMEGYSVEDNGEGICFNVYCYNVQPGVEIDYATGISWLSGETPPAVDKEPETEKAQLEAEGTYVLNISSKRIHMPYCSSVEDMKPENRKDYTGETAPLLEQGYTTCGSCFGK
jgi:DNA-entry nuclease